MPARCQALWVSAVMLFDVPNTFASAFSTSAFFFFSFLSSSAVSQIQMIRRAL